MDSDIELARIKPFKYDDKLTGHKIAIELSHYYSKLSVDDRVYYFNKETGEFDGTSYQVADFLTPCSFSHSRAPSAPPCSNILA